MNRRGRQRLRWFAAAAGAAFVGCAMFAAPALAGLGFYITLHNETGAPRAAAVTLVAARGEDCWDTRDLNHSLDNRYVYPKAWSARTKLTYYTEKKTTLFECDSAGTRGIDLLVRDHKVDETGKWYLPSGSPPDFRITYQDTGAHPGFALRDMLQTWVPRTDGEGLICWRATTTTTGINDAHADIYVYNDAAHCDVRGPVDVWNGTALPSAQSSSLAASDWLPFRGTFTWPSAGDVTNTSPRGSADFGGESSAVADAAAADRGSVVDLPSTVAVACPWYAYPDDDKRCSGYEPGNPERWLLDYVTKGVRDSRVTGSVGTRTDRQLVASDQVSIPKTSEKGELSVTKSVAISQRNNTMTKNGGRLGTRPFEEAASFGLKRIYEGGFESTQEIFGEYRWSTTKEVENTRAETVDAHISVGAPPGYTTTLEVFTTKTDANYTYAADLDFGKVGGVEPVVTPANAALDQSPSLSQPCLGYVVGGKDVRNSLQFIGDQALKDGFSPTDPTLPAERRTFLNSIPSFTIPVLKDGPTNTCPGFPSGFAAAAGFKGSGVGTYASVGFDAQGHPLDRFTGCVYQTPFPATAAAARRLTLASPWAQPAASDGPCQDVPVAGGVVHAKPGALIDDRHDPVARGAAVIAPRGSDDILGPDTGGTIETNNGAMDIVRAGPAPTRVIGGSGENLIYGGSRGADVLIGGHGINYLYAGTGARTTLEESRGFADMFGGPGNNTFEGRDMRGVMFGGAGANTMIATGNTSGVEMTAGPGNNLYEIDGTGTPRIVQLSGTRDHARLLTDHSLTVPLYIPTAEATGSQNATLVGSQGTATLIANAGNDTLVSGPGPETLRGGPGADTIVFNDDNDDVATGGTGADLYRFTGTPETFQRPPGLQALAQRTAALITNFNPGKGDRLVLSAKVLGTNVLQLRRHFLLVAGSNPSPRTARPTLLFNTQNDLLSFDPDGTGPISDQVIARLPGWQTIAPSWMQIIT